MREMLGAIFQLGVGIVIVSMGINYIPTMKQNLFQVIFFFGIMCSSIWSTVPILEEISKFLEHYFKKYEKEVK